MPRKRTLLSGLVIVIIFLIITVIFITSYSNSPESLEDDQSSNNITPESLGDNQSPNSSEKPEEDLFVVPESPVGTVGLVSAIAIAFGLFALSKKQRK